MRDFCLVVMAMVVVSRSANADAPSLIGVWKVVVFQDDGKDRLSRIGAGPAKRGGEPRVAKLVFTANDCYLIRGDGRRIG